VDAYAIFLVQKSKEAPDFSTTLLKTATFFQLEVAFGTKMK
jgi:hypothetical protein